MNPARPTLAAAAAGAALACLAIPALRAPGVVEPPLPPLPYRLSNPSPSIIPEDRANPGPVADKFASRVRSLDERATLRAYDGAPPVIPHPIADMNIHTCRACHAEGLRAGGLTARMVSHTYLPNCTQCHVEAAGPFLDPRDSQPHNTFVGTRPSGYGSTRAWSGAPPIMPHTTFMRNNCVSCHGEHGYDGWRPDHLSRTNCVQCHTPAAHFEQLSPSFGMPDIPDGVLRHIDRLQGSGDGR